MMRKKRSRAAACAVVLIAVLLMGTLSGCSAPHIIFTAGQKKNEVFRIDKEICTIPEIMVYLTTTQRQYENAYGAEIWDTQWQGISFRENVKENVLEKLAQMKTMYLMAKERKINLEQSEQEKVEKATEKYLKSLSEAEKEAMQVTEKDVKKLYTQYALANKVYQQIIGEVNPEISDDEARTVSVQRIAFYKTSKNFEGIREVMTAKEQEELYKKAGEVRELAMQPDQDFAELAGKYSDDRTLNYSIGKEDVEPSVARVIFGLETREISEVIETEKGYFIVKCISTFDKSKTEENKKTLIEKRKMEAFGEQYESYVEALVRRMNSSVWDEITFIDVTNGTNTDFFAIYEEFFPNRKGL